MATPNPNPTSKPPNVYQIGGVPVEFPYKPYGSQLAFMGRVISTLDRARRNGHCHALLESPTGTGKSLSLLCSALAWQQHQQRRPQTSPSPNPLVQSDHDPLLHGGGFVPEPEPSRNTEQVPQATSARAQRKLTMPTIYYASRTHSQISQVIREYRKTSYRVPMAILASRKHYCTNKHVCSSEKVDEQCKLLLKDTSLGCLEFKNAHKVKAHPSLQKGGSHEVHDIEDLVKVGRTVKGCAYFAAQTMAAEAQIVFSPYSYIVNPIVRRAMDVDIKGSIVILDEAHNIEDMARDAGSLDVDEEVLCTLETELGQLCSDDSVAMIYRPLYDVIQGLVSWIAGRKDNLQKTEFEHYSSYWTGDKAMRELQHAGITQQLFPILQECATKAVKAVSDAESDGAHLSGISAIILEEIFSSLSYFFSGTGCHSSDYQLALQRYVKRDDSNTAAGWKCTMSLWCLNPAVVFREIANLSLSVILTSGTLSPMGSFASELGVQFESCFEAPHVIDVESQLWAAVIASGPANSQLNASYRTADGYAFQDALGTTLEEICGIVPGGALVFFPSYKLLDKLRARWCQTGQWSRLNAAKPVFVEPRGNTEEFEPVLKGYYNAILGKNKAVTGKMRGGSKRIFKSPGTKGSSQNHVKRGATLLAVCRGKVSEGIDFSDENARVVVIVGIPFPNKNDIQVTLKKRYNDTHKSSKGLLSGSEWYCHQAFRTLNQAAGRCIRHRFDYGAIILIDERYKEERNLTYISKWLRNSIRHYGSFEETIDGLQTFFQNVETQVNAESKGASATKDELQIDVLPCDSNKRMLPWSEPSFSIEGIPQKKNQKVKRLDHQNRKKMIPDNESATKPKQSKSTTVAKEVPLSSLKSQCQLDVKTFLKTNDEVLRNYRDYINLEDDTHQHSRYLEATYAAASENSLHPSPIVEHSIVTDQVTTPREIPEAENLFAEVANSCNQCLDRPAFSLSATSSNGNLSDEACISAVTPERVASVDFCNSGQESSLNKSVDSQFQKRRKSIGSQLTRCTYMNHFISPGVDSLCRVDCVSSSISRDTGRESELPSPTNCSGLKNRKLIQMFLDRSSGTLPFFEQFMLKNLHICCLRCKIPLGLPKHNFIVPCSLTSLSKAYLTYVLKSGTPSICLSDDLSRMPRESVYTVICDTSSVDQRIFNRCSNEGVALHDVWCEEDGCVFRIVTCPFCTTCDTSLGVQIMAADASNVHLLNKVLFYADYLDMIDQQSSRNDKLPNSIDMTSQGKQLIEIEKYASNPELQDSGFLVTRKAKPKLPKRG
ncbi:uncharacterized protein [Typha latifolia]|uniref:uncharacterized protein isoform X2 n=1 Tax=Typha latifolia TaxID=4733 RepID=UPI003C2B6334